ncbi:MAG: glycosyltransferase [Acidimicrobiales bacterium]
MWSGRSSPIQSSWRQTTSVSKARRAAPRSKGSSCSSRPQRRLAEVRVSSATVLRSALVVGAACYERAVPGQPDLDLLWLSLPESRPGRELDWLASMPGTARCRRWASAPRATTSRFVERRYRRLAPLRRGRRPGVVPRPRHGGRARGGRLGRLARAVRARHRAGGTARPAPRRPPGGAHVGERSRNPLYRLPRTARRWVGPAGRPRRLPDRGGARPLPRPRLRARAAGGRAAAPRRRAVPSSGVAGRRAHRRLRVPPGAEQGHRSGARRLAAGPPPGPDARLLVAGRGPLEGLVRAGRRGPSIELVGSLPAPEVARLLGRLAVFVTAPRPTAVWNEQFGLAYVEAMATGVPVVTTVCGTNHEAVLPPSIRVPDEVGALADGLVHFLDDPALRRRLAPQLRAAVVERFERGQQLAALRAAFDAVS